MGFYDREGGAHGVGKGCVGGRWREGRKGGCGVWTGGVEVGGGEGGERGC